LFPSPSLEDWGNAKSSRCIGSIGGEGEGRERNERRGGNKKIENTSSPLVRRGEAQTSSDLTAKLKIL